MTLIIVIGVFLWNMHVNIQRGIHVNVFETVGLALSYLLATLGYSFLAQGVSLWAPYPGLTLDTHFTYIPDELVIKSDQIFYQATAFLLILFVGYGITKLLTHIIGDNTDILYPSKQDKIVGGLLSVVRTWLGWVVFFSYIATFTFPAIQNFLANNIVADFFIRKTPLFSTHIWSMWLNQIAQLK